MPRVTLINLIWSGVEKEYVISWLQAKQWTEEDEELEDAEQEDEDEDEEEELEEEELEPEEQEEDELEEDDEDEDVGQQ